REAGPEGEPLEHIFAARSRRGGAVFDPAVRVDAGTPVPLAAHLDHKWGPTLAASGRSLYAAWADFRNYNWDIFLARSVDRGVTWGPNVQVDDFPDLERIDERPSLAAERPDRVHVVWTDLRAREADTNIFYARSDDGGGHFTPNRQLDDSKVGFDPDHDTPSNQWHPSLAVDRGHLVDASGLPTSRKPEHISLPVTTAVFYLLAAVTLGSACGVAFGTNILYSAFALMGTFLGVAAIFVLLGADFLGVIQLFVYVGGILVLTLFAVMLTHRIDVQVSNRAVGRLPGLVVVGVVATWMIRVART